MAIEHGNGYLSGRVFNSNMFAHRAAFALGFGRWPNGEVDHINGDRRDNRLVNLREVNSGTNRRNMRLHGRNKSGASGVFQSGTRWKAYINISGKRINLGSFGSFEAALERRKSAESELGFHKNHGRKI